MGILAIGLIMFSPTSIMPRVNAQIDPLDQSNVAPPMPTAIGCYHYDKTTGWQTAACVADSVIKERMKLHQIAIPQVVPPTEGGSNGVYGLRTTSTTPTHAKTLVTFTAYGGESDSKSFSTAWSIQTNTNFFTGNNGDTDWVQFTEQNDNNNAVNREACVWQIDVTTTNYGTPTCISVPTQTLSSSYSGYVTGDVVVVGGITKLQTNYCNVGISQCWGAIVADTYGLAASSNWSDASGTILGLGAGSTANFNHITSESTTVSASSETSANFLIDVTTGEFNDFTYNSHSTSCSSGTCTTTTTSSV